MIWEILSVALTIMTGIILVSFALPELPRAVLLCMGALLQFGLTVAVAKHRFIADARSEFLKELETGIPNVKTFPVETNETILYLEERNSLTKDKLRLYHRLIKFRAEISLLYVMFSVLMMTLILVIYVVVQLIFF